MMISRRMKRAEIEVEEDGMANLKDVDMKQSNLFVML